MARTATKILTTLATAAIITAVTPAAVQAESSVEVVSVSSITSSINVEAVAPVVTVENDEEVQATQVAVEDTTQAVAETAPAPAPVVSGPFVISSSCVGGQDAIDHCLGATYYAPVADYLGVPYYAQHNGMGGEAWLALQVGDEVVVDGVSYTVSAIRTVATGGDVDQIAGMGGAAYLQTCLDDEIHSNVYALVRN